MKKKTMKKILNGYLSGRWWTGVHIETVNGEDVVYANLPTAVRVYLDRETVKRGRCWRESPAYNCPLSDLIEID